MRARHALIRPGIALAAALLAACASAPVPAPVHLVVLHTNDVHGQVLPRPAT